jgi:hypothetical protein
MRGYQILLSLLFAFSFLSAQTDSLAKDSIEAAKKQKQKIYSAPRRASIKSAIIPGLGQIQNRKYWKIPVIYVALGGFGYMFQVNNDKYNLYRNALRNSVDNGGFSEVDGERLTTSDLQSLKLNFRRYRDIAVIGMSIVYILNIVDANVDAHLKTFDVSDDLGLRVQPLKLFLFPQNQSGLAAGL